MGVRTDSRSITILAIFAAMILALEILPIPLLTDIPLFAGFTLDPTGIPITIVFLAFGSVFSFILILIMWIAIAYRNPVGSIFKGFAEVYTLVGLIIAKLFLRNRSYDWRVAAPVYVIFGVAFRTIGMYVTNIFLIQWLYGMPADGAILLSGTFIVPNIIQALINTVVGIFVFIIIPENLAIQARFGKYGTDEYQKYEEISVDDMMAPDDEQQTD